MRIAWIQIQLFCEWGRPPKSRGPHRNVFWGNYVMWLCSSHEYYYMRIAWIQVPFFRSSWISQKSRGPNRNCFGGNYFSLSIVKVRVISSCRQQHAGQAEQPKMEYCDFRRQAFAKWWQRALVYANVFECCISEIFVRIDSLQTVRRNNAGTRIRADWNFRTAVAIVVGRTGWPCPPRAALT